MQDEGLDVHSVLHAINIAKANRAMSVLNSMLEGMTTKELIDLADKLVNPGKGANGSGSKKPKS